MLIRRLPRLRRAHPCAQRTASFATSRVAALRTQLAVDLSAEVVQRRDRPRELLERLVLLPNDLVLLLQAVGGLHGLR